MRGNTRAGGVIRYLAVVAVLLLGGGVARAETFAVPPSLRPQVDFWIAVFATYSKHQEVIHDTEHLDRVYAVLDFRDLARQGLSDSEIDPIMRRAEAAEKARIQGMLYRLHANPDPATLTDEERRLQALFAGDRSPTRYLDAAADERLRGQRGLRERFAVGVATGQAYFPQMEAIFRAHRVPVEITRLPLVESTFNMKAYSKVGAAGIWQFMPGTARHYMRVDNLVDERLDPLVATRAAARFLRQNYERLGTWPLAIKAYNHGPAGMARAVRDTGTLDIATIIRRYRGPAFRFASRNFYPEFLAALHVERNHHKYFGELTPHRLPRTTTVTVPAAMPISAAARCAGDDPLALIELNPSLLPPVRTGRAAIPRGYALRVPADAGDRYTRCAARLPRTQIAAARRTSERRAGASRGRHGAARPRTHRVQRGQTLSGIARRYGCSTAQLQRGNKLKSRMIRTGQVLRIPPC